MPRDVLATGSTLNARYCLLSVLGQGASSVVYAARDSLLERDVAVKILHSAPVELSSQPHASFLREARLLARLRHPHVVSIHDVGETDDGRSYLVMELAAGETLETRLQDGLSLRASEALRLLLPVMGALAVVHDAGIVHRDIKPTNLALAADDGCAKLLDFGVAKSRDGECSGLAVGTPSYMSPEEARGEAVSSASDVWSMGVMLFRCFSGCLPFQGRTPAVVLTRIVQGNVPSLRALAPSLPLPVCVVVERALAADPRVRFSDMRALARALVLAATQAAVALPDAPDPVGLPLYASWRAEATQDRTDVLEPPGSCATQASERPYRRALWPFALAATLTATVGVTGLLWPTEDAVSAVNEDAVSAINDSDADPRRQSASDRPLEWGASASPVYTLAISPSASPKFAAVFPQSVATLAQSVRDRRAIRESEASPRAHGKAALLKAPQHANIVAPDAAPQSIPSARGGGATLVTQWDW